MEVSIGTILLIAFPVLLFFVFYFKDKKSKYHLPPGPKGLPFLGYYLNLKPSFSQALLKLGKQFGPVFTVKLGQRTLFVLHSYEAVKEALVTQGDIFSGRFKDTFFDLIKRDYGVVGSDGPSWRTKRRNSLHILRDFGFGKEGSKEVIQNEIEDIFKVIDSNKGAGFETKQMFNSATSNIICAISMNERPAYNDKRFQRILFLFDRITSGSIADAVLLFFPVLNKIPFLNNLFQGRVTDFNECFKFIEEKLLEHRKSFDPNQEARDFMDAMLLLEKEAKKEPGYTKKDYDWTIIRIVFELFIAGSDTTATTLGWFTGLMAAYPDIQVKAQKEIDSVVSKDGIIKMENRKDLPYTCAVVDEVQRFASIASFSVAHRNEEDTKLFGYDIPKDSFIFPHLDAVHHDEGYWKKPHSFYPEHFLTSDGKSYKPDDHLIPFSIGKRACMGESLASMELFLVSSSILREYTVQFDHKYPDTELQDLLKGNAGGIHRIKPHQIVFKRRSR